MSIDVNWDKITSGPQGEALAESVRAFVHDKFQQVTLPGFIRSVQVHSFDFGKVGPRIEIVDVGDPLSEFYDDDDDDDDESEEEGDTEGFGGNVGKGEHEEHRSHNQRESDQQRRKEQARRFEAGLERQDAINATLTGDEVTSRPRRPIPSPIDTACPPPQSLRPPFNRGDRLESPFPRSNTPGIPGGTSNLSYFHLPLGGLSGTQTPLAAIASGTTNLPMDGGGNYHQPRRHADSLIPNSADTGQVSSSRPSTTAGSAIPPAPTANDGLAQANSPRLNSPSEMSSSLTSQALQPGQIPSPPDLTSAEFVDSPARDPSDLQVITHVSYDGDIRLSLTAEILLDYPMPSFVSIPLKLSITGLTFDGIAILAWLRKNLHFCFLGEDDAALILGEPDHDDQDKKILKIRDASADHKHYESGGRKAGGLLEEIRVESEIGRKETGKQVLKNVGKVERFVLEQVRRIFEEELVFPSYWTFLV